MIKYVVGDATHPEGDGLKVIVHCCNDVGKWGAGFTGALSRRWDKPEQMYRGLAARTLGYVQFVEIDREFVVANLIGQHGVRRRGSFDREPPVRYWAIREGLERVTDYCLHREASVHMPRLGTGLAGGTWEEILELIKLTLFVNHVPVTVYDLP